MEKQEEKEEQEEQKPDIHFLQEKVKKLLPDSVSSLVDDLCGIVLMATSQ